MASALITKRGTGGVIKGETTTSNTTTLTIFPSNNAQIAIVTNVPNSGSYSTGIIRLVILNGQISDGSYYRGGTNIEKIPDNIRTEMSYNPRTGKITIPITSRTHFMGACPYEYVGW